MVKKRVYAAVGPPGVVGDSACGKISRGTWEARRDAGKTAIHNRKHGSARESERPIVVKKQGNACGAKGDDCKYVEVKV